MIISDKNPPPLPCRSLLSLFFDLSFFFLFSFLSFLYLEGGADSSRLRFLSNSFRFLGLMGVGLGPNSMKLVSLVDVWLNESSMIVPLRVICFLPKSVIVWSSLLVVTGDVCFILLVKLHLLLFRAPFYLYYLFYYCFRACYLRSYSASISFAVIDLFRHSWGTFHTLNCPSLLEANNTFFSLL